MSRSLKAVPVVLLAFVLAGCTTGGGSTTSRVSTPRSSEVIAANDGGYDLGNGRPEVTHDGLMVRRRVAIAIYPSPGANRVSVRRKLDDAAIRAHTSLSSISPGVLEPALLEPVAPEMTLVLPARKSIADARKLIDLATSKRQRLPGVARFNIASVLVHDLRFTVSSAEPAVLAAAIAREGILADALDNYTTTLGHHRLDITYTGPLLSDELVESVRAGIARRAHVQPAAVTISARSTTGVGVDLAKEPVPAPAIPGASTAHHHGAEQSHH